MVTKKPAKLSKPKFIAALKCPKRLPWLVHEPVLTAAGRNATSDLGPRASAGSLNDVPAWNVTAEAEYRGRRPSTEDSNTAVSE